MRANSRPLRVCTNMRAMSLLYGISALALLATCEGFATARFTQTHKSANTVLYRPANDKNGLEIQHPFLYTDGNSVKRRAGRLPGLNPPSRSALRHPFLLEPHGILRTPLQLAGVGSGSQSKK